MVILNLNAELGLQIAELLLEIAERREDDVFRLQGAAGLHIVEKLVGFAHRVVRCLIWNGTKKGCHAIKNLCSKNVKDGI